MGRVAQACRPTTPRRGTFRQRRPPSQLQTRPLCCRLPRRAIGAEVLVDDNPAYALECAQAGIHVLLYDWKHGYPWSRTADGPSHSRITR